MRLKIQDAVVHLEPISRRWGRRDWAAVWAAVALTLATACAAPPPWVPETQLAQATRELTASPRALLVIYRAPWCASCRALSASFADPRVRRALADANARVVVVELNRAGEPIQEVPAPYATAAQGVSAIPALRWFAAEDPINARARRDAFMGPASLAAWLRAAAGPQAPAL